MGNMIHKIEELACVPKEVTQGLPNITMQGCTDIYIENHRGILEYTSENIRIQSKIGKIEMCGRNLHIEYYSNDEIKIHGFISKIEFQKGGSIC